MVACGHQIPIKSHKAWWRGRGGGEATDRSAPGVIRVLRQPAGHELKAFIRFYTTKHHSPLCSVLSTSQSLIRSPNYNRVICLLSLHYLPLICPFTFALSHHIIFLSPPCHSPSALWLSICLTFTLFFLMPKHSLNFLFTATADGVAIMSLVRRMCQSHFSTFYFYFSEFSLD